MGKNFSRTKITGLFSVDNPPASLAGNTPPLNGRSKGLSCQEHAFPVLEADSPKDTGTTLPNVGVYIVMVGIDAIEIASDAILIASHRSTDHILAGQTAT
jgi:hypothetical protein